LLYIFFNTSCQYALMPSYLWFNALWLAVLCYVNPYYSIMSYGNVNFYFWFVPFRFAPTFAGTQLEHKKRAFCTAQCKNPE
jgi:hypothetical protein